MPNNGPNDARAELQSWYVRGLRPKLARAARTGAVDPRAVAELDAAVRGLLDSPADELRLAAPTNAGTP